MIWKVSRVVIDNKPDHLIIHESKWGGRVIADFGAYDDCNPADAQLMVAAPELLAACQRMLPWIERMLEVGAHLGAISPHGCKQAMRQAQAAIEKAGTILN